MASTVHVEYVVNKMHWKSFTFSLHNNNSGLNYFIFRFAGEVENILNWIKFF
jgi:hypothetical protein